MSCFQTMLLVLWLCLYLVSSYAVLKLLNVTLCLTATQGMQRNPGYPSIEGELEKAICKAGGISKANADSFTKVFKHLLSIIMSYTPILLLA